MDFTAVIAALKQEGLAARRFEKGGRGRFRDCVTVGRNGRVLFQRFNYGEAAGLVLARWGAGVEADGTLLWRDAAPGQTAQAEVPQRLDRAEPEALWFDGAAAPWPLLADLRTWREGGLGRLRMLLWK